jgi:hypothetical protein
MGKQTTEMAFAELRGTRAWTQDEGHRVIDAWRASGQTVARFAKSSGLPASRIYRWQRRLGGSAAEVQLAPRLAPAFVPVVVRAREAARAAITVCTREGHRVEVGTPDAQSARWVATFVRSLEEVAS